MKLLAKLLLNRRGQSVTMKQLMILGGFVGFAIGIAFGVAQDSAWPNVLWRASVAAFVAGMVLRWWGRVCLASLAEARRERAADPETSAVASTVGKAIV